MDIQPNAVLIVNPVSDHNSREALQCLVRIALMLFRYIILWCLHGNALFQKHSGILSNTRLFGRPQWSCPQRNTELTLRSSRVARRQQEAYTPGKHVRQYSSKKYLKKNPSEVASSNALFASVSTPTAWLYTVP